jgi:enoyl-CoA hydratase/carnithine racemase
MPTFFEIAVSGGLTVLRLRSDDGTNRMSRDCVAALTAALGGLAREAKPLVIAGNRRFYSAGADLAEIAALNGPAARDFSRMGQCLMNAIEHFPVPVYAAVEGYCVGGGLGLALACHRRIASPRAIFGHGGAALGLITGWGGTQRLSRLIGKGRSLAMLVVAEKIHAHEAKRIGLVDAVVDDPIAESVTLIEAQIRATHGLA